MKRAFLTFGLLLCVMHVRARADAGDDTLKFYLSKSDVVIWGTIISEPQGVTKEVSAVDYLCDFKVSGAFKGSPAVKDGLIKVTIERFEMGARDRSPLLKKGSECVLFLKKMPAQLPEFQTADIWFGVQPFSPSMAQALQRLADKS